MKRLFPYLAASLGIHAVVLLLVLAALARTRQESVLRPGVVLVDFSQPLGSPGQRSQARTDASGLARLRPPAQSLSSDAEVAGD
ncbi:MAG: hypothetical protein HUU37_10290, partial [Bdellovibrionales bacterium]|nr:hypothetical protein [Bdellovibrionales bacterium]